MSNGLSLWSFLLLYHHRPQTSMGCLVTFKIMWYKENAPGLYEKAYKFIGTKDYINLLLTGVLSQLIFPMSQAAEFTICQQEAITFRM